MDYIDYKRKYKELVMPHVSKFQKIAVPDAKIVRLNEFINELIPEKSGEAEYMKDYSQKHRRFYTGFLGELALEEYLGVEFIDWTVGESTQYSVPDLSKLGLDIGIKTAEVWNFPVIHKRAKRPEIINIKLNDQVVYICGIASIDVLNKYHSTEYVKSPLLLAKGTKTGFYGFEHLEKYEYKENRAQENNLVL